MTRYAHAPDVLWRRTGDRLLATHPSLREVVSLSGSAMVLWDVLDAPITIEEAADVLSELYGVASDDVVASVAPVVEDLARRRLLEKLG